LGKLLKYEITITSYGIAKCQCYCCDVTKKQRKSYGPNAYNLPELSQIYDLSDLINNLSYTRVYARITLKYTNNVQCSNNNYHTITIAQVFFVSWQARQKCHGGLLLNEQVSSDTPGSLTILSKY